MCLIIIIIIIMIIHLYICAQLDKQKHDVVFMNCTQTLIISQSVVKHSGQDAVFLKRKELAHFKVRRWVFTCPLPPPISHSDTDDQGAQWRSITDCYPPQISKANCQNQRHRCQSPAQFCCQYGDSNKE